MKAPKGAGRGKKKIENRHGEVEGKLHSLLIRQQPYLEVPCLLAEVWRYQAE